MNDEPRPVSIRRPADIAVARRAAMHVLDSVGAAQTIKTRFVTAVSEIARNALVHASGGVMEFGFSQLKGTRSIVARCRDHGPGIPDIEQALERSR